MRTAKWQNIAGSKQIFRWENIHGFLLKINIKHMRMYFNDLYCGFNELY